VIHYTNTEMPFQGSARTAERKKNAKTNKTDKVDC